MAKINPTELRWSAPTEDTDGEAITEPLSYTLGIDHGPAVAEVASFPGTLNPDGKYSVKYADLPIVDGAYTLVLRAFYQSNPELKSAWSESIDIVLGVAPPNPPFSLEAA